MSGIIISGWGTAGSAKISSGSSSSDGSLSDTSNKSSIIASVGIFRSK